jgi:hypothetical protein
MSVPELILRPNPSVPAPGNALITPTVCLFDGTENLRITSASSVSVVLTVYIRMRREDGTIAPMAVTHTPNTDRSVKTQDVAVGAGVLLNLLIVPTTGAPLVGETFVQAMIVRGLGAATLPMGILAQDYTTARQPVAWPGATLRRSTEGNGVLRSLGAHSQTGAPCDILVPTGARWRINTIAVRLNTVPCGLVGNRFAYLSYNDGSTAQVRFQVISPYGQGVGLNERYFFVNGAAPMDGLANGFALLPGPAGIQLRAGDTIEGGWTGVNEGLELVSVDAQVEEFLEFA